MSILEWVRKNRPKDLKTLDIPILKRERIKKEQSYEVNEMKNKTLLTLFQNTSNTRSLNFQITSMKAIILQKA